MEIFEIVEYQYSWNLSKNIGFLRFKLKGAAHWNKWRRVEDRFEFLIFITTLQNEKPVYLIEDNHHNFHLQTHVEPVGDAEPIK